MQFIEKKKRDQIKLIFTLLHAIFCYLQVGLPKHQTYPTHQPAGFICTSLTFVYTRNSLHPDCSHTGITYTHFLLLFSR